MKEIKPNKISFLFFGSAVKVFLIWFLILIIATGLNLISFWQAVVLVLFFVLLAFLYDLGKYNKEKYVIDDVNIIRYFWNWFSDNSIEISFNKIVEVKLTLPFFQYLFFKTGKISILTASGWNIYMLNLNNPTEVYKEILQRMNKAWYNIWEWDLVVETKPSTLWVIWEVFNDLFRGVWIVWVVYFWVLIKSLLENWYSNKVLYLIFSIVLWIIWILFFFKYMDYKRRIYRLYTDRVEYYEWFLTKHHAIIPIEAISDVENTQSFFSRLLWIHDIVISAKGSTNNIVFLNILNWEKFIQSVKYIKDKIDENVIKEEKIKENIIKHKNKIDTPLEYDRHFKALFTISKKKIIISSLPFIIIPPVFIIILVVRLFYAIFTRYKIDEWSLEYTFDFLSKKYISFKVENITKVTFTQSILDKILKTWTIRFYSLGASFPLVFRDISFSDDLKKKILQKVWIFDEEVIKEFKPDFNFKNFIFSQLFIIIILLINTLLIWFGSNYGIVWILLFIILFVLFYLYNYLLYKKYYFAKVRKNYIEVKRWIVFETHSIALIRNIKWISTIKFPLSTTWNLTFDISWETITSSKWDKRMYMVSNSITFNYVANVFTYHDAFDKYLNGGQLDTTSIILTKPALINVVVPIVIIGILTSILGIGVIILLIILPYIVWAIKVQYYDIQKDRVLHTFWIIYKGRKTVVVSNIEVVQMSRDLLNKIFKNGNVDIYTLWSTSIDMRIKNIKDYQKVYEILKEMVK